MAKLNPTQELILSLVRAERQSSKDILDLYAEVVMQYSIDRQADNIAFFINAYRKNKVIQKKMFKLTRLFGSFSFKFDDAKVVTIVNKKVSKKEKLAFRLVAKKFSAADYSSITHAYDALCGGKAKEKAPKKLSELYAEFNKKLEKLEAEGMLERDVSITSVLENLNAHVEASEEGEVELQLAHSAH